MKLWVFTCSDSPFEHWLDGFEERFDAWEDGGVRGLAVGRMTFLQDDGTTIPAWAPDPKVYEALGAEVPEQRPRDLTKEKKLHAMLDNAAKRGWRLLIFAGGGPTAHVQDQMNAFPSGTRRHCRRSGRKPLRAGLPPRGRAPGGPTR